MSPERLTRDPDRLKVIQEWPTPRTKHKVRSFLGLCTYYRQFIPGFIDMMKQLIRLTEEIQTFQWPSKEAAPFRSLKKALFTTPVISYLQPG